MSKTQKQDDFFEDAKAFSKHVGNVYQWDCLVIAVAPDIPGYVYGSGYKKKEIRIILQHFVKSIKQQEDRRKDNIVQLFNNN